MFFFLLNLCELTRLRYKAEGEDFSLVGQQVLAEERCSVTETRSYGSNACGALWLYKCNEVHQTWGRQSSLGQS